MFSDDLYAEIIVPRPLPLEERDVDSLSLEELRELTRQQQETIKMRDASKSVPEKRKAR